MNPSGKSWSQSKAVSAGITLSRWLLGGLFIYMGLSKVMDPVGFLKLARQYDLVRDPLWLNVVAANLPWFEVFCGLLLMLGVAVRGAAVMSLAMLVPFTAMVLHRALAIHAGGTLPFCAIRFDCGCGAGEVLICLKLAENCLLMLLSALLLIWQNDRFCLRYSWGKPVPGLG